MVILMPPLKLAEVGPGPLVENHCFMHRQSYYWVTTASRSEDTANTHSQGNKMEMLILGFPQLLETWGRLHKQFRLVLKVSHLFFFFKAGHNFLNSVMKR